MDLNRLLRNLIDVLFDIERGHPEEPVIDLDADRPDNSEPSAPSGQYRSEDPGPKGADHGLLDRH